MIAGGGNPVRAGVGVGRVRCGFRTGRGRSVKPIGIGVTFAIAAAAAFGAALLLAWLIMVQSTAPVQVFGA